MPSHDYKNTYCISGLAVCVTYHLPVFCCRYRCDLVYYHGVYIDGKKDGSFIELPYHPAASVTQYQHRAINYLPTNNSDRAWINYRWLWQADWIRIWLDGHSSEASHSLRPSGMRFACCRVGAWCKVHPNHGRLLSVFPGLAYVHEKMCIC